MKNIIKIAIPSGKNIVEPVFEVLQNDGYINTKNLNILREQIEQRKYILKSEKILINRVPTQFAIEAAVTGLVDFSLIGEDIILERFLRDKYFEEDLLTKGYKSESKRLSKKWRLEIATKKEFEYKDAESLKGNIIATKYPFIVLDYIQQKLGKQSYFASLFLRRNTLNVNSIQVMKVDGSTEGIIGFYPELIAIADIVQSGNTLKANNLVSRERIKEFGIAKIEGLKDWR